MNLNNKLNSSVPMRYSIRFRLLVFGIIMSIFPLTILGYFYVQNFKNNLEQNIRLNIEASSQRVATDLDFLIGGQIRQVTLLSNAIGERLFDRDESIQEGALYNLLKEAPFLEELSLVGANGEEIKVVSRRLVLNKKPTGFKNEAAFRNLIEGNLQWSRTFIDQYGQVRLERIIPIKRQSNGQFMGGLILEISLRGVIDQLSKKHPEYQGRIFVIDGKGKLIGHQDFSQVLRQTDVRSSLAVKKFIKSRIKPLKDTKVEEYQSYDGQEVLGIAVPVNNLDWAVIQEIPVKNAFANVNKLTGRLLLSGIILIFLVTVVNTYSGIKFSSTIKDIEQSVQEIRTGNLEKEVNVKGKSELSRLGETLNSMRDELRIRRQQEQALRHAEKLSSLGLMAAGVAHELNNPLAVMSAYAEDLQDRIEEEGVECLAGNGEISNYLDVIIKQTKRCKQITGNLLNFSRQSGDDCQFTNIKELVNSTLELVRYRLKKGNINTEITIPPVGHLKGSSEEVQQVLLNIIINSLDALEPGGWLKIYGQVEGDNFILKIEDNGIGIKPENMKHLMDPFFTTKAPGKGTGLGLSISFSIMQRIGGNVEIESNLGKGTLVTLTFPMVKEE